MSSAQQIVPKYTFPHEETYINDNTSKYLTDPVNNSVVYPYLSVFASSRGIDNTLVRMDSLAQYDRMYGKTDYRKYGQAHMMPRAFLSQDNTVAWCMRVMPDDATYANSVLSLWYKEDETNKKFRIKFTTKQITVDSDKTTGEAAMKKILADRNSIIEYAAKTDGTAVEGVYKDDEGYTQVPLLVFTSLGRGAYGQNLRWRISLDEDYEKEYGVKVYRFEVIDVTDGATVANVHIGSLVSSGKTSSAVLINDVIDDTETADLTMKIHCFEENFEDLYDVYKKFCQKIQEAEPSTSITIPDVDQFDPFFGMQVKVQKVRVTPAEPFISFTYKLTDDVNKEDPEYKADDYTNTNIASIDDIAGNKLSGGSDGAFDEVDAEKRQKAIDDCYIKAFTGKLDKQILAPRRIESLALYDANYSMDVKMQLVRLALYRESAPVYLDTGFTDELGTIDINTLEADFSPLDELIDEFNNFEEAWCVSINTHWYYGREASTGKKVKLTSTYYLASTDSTFRQTYGETESRTNTKAILTGHIKNSVYPAISEAEKELKQELYNARINYFEDEGNNTFYRATQSMYVHTDSVLIEETNVIALFRLKKILEDEFRDKRNEITTPKKRSEFRDHLLEKYSYMVGTYFDSLDIQYKSNEYEQRRNITHCYAAVTFPQRSKITLIEIDVNERAYQPDETDEES